MSSIKLLSPTIPAFTFKSEEWESWFDASVKLLDWYPNQRKHRLIPSFIPWGIKRRISYSLCIIRRGNKKYSVMIEKFNGHFTKHCNIIYDRAKFNSRMQQDGELVEKSIHKVHAQAQHCSYGELHDQMVCDLIVIGIHNTSLSQKLQMGSRFDFRKSNQYGS